MEGRASIEFLLTMWPLQDSWEIHALIYFIQNSLQSFISTVKTGGISLFLMVSKGTPKAAAAESGCCSLFTLTIQINTAFTDSWAPSQIHPFFPIFTQICHVSSQLNHRIALTIHCGADVCGSEAFLGCALCSLSVRIKHQHLWRSSWDTSPHCCCLY